MAMDVVPVTLVVRLNSARNEDYRAAECCRDKIYLSPNLAIHIDSRGRRHDTHVFILFRAVRGMQTDFNGWKRCWKRTIEYRHDMRPDLSPVDPDSVGLYIAVDKSGRSAQASVQMFFDRIGTDHTGSSYHNRWHFKNVWGEPPALIKLCTEEQAERKGSTYDCSRLTRRNRKQDEEYRSVHDGA